MKKAEFVKMFKQHREAAYRAEVKAGRMRTSEAVMGMADADRDAGSLWRKHRKTWAPLTTDKAKELLGWKD